MPTPATAGRVTPPLVEEGLLATLLGGGLPRDAERHLEEAGRSYHRDEIAEWHSGQRR